jgi:hypothetical protein
MTWIVTMWHFGHDSLTGYTGERFEISWKEGLKVFRIYSKGYRNKKVKMRKETQELILHIALKLLFIISNFSSMPSFSIQAKMS